MCVCRNTNRWNVSIVKWCSSWNTIADIKIFGWMDESILVDAAIQPPPYMNIYRTKCSTFLFSPSKCERAYPVNSIYDHYSFFFGMCLVLQRALYRCYLFEYISFSTTRKSKQQKKQISVLAKGIFERISFYPSALSLSIAISKNQQLICTLINWTLFGTSSSFHWNHQSGAHIHLYIIIIIVVVHFVRISVQLRDWKVFVRENNTISLKLS